jgi:trk system potassium uptake protein TrkH
MRQRTYLRERYSGLLGVSGAIFTIIGVIYLVPLLLLVFYPDEIDQAGGFLAAGLPLIVVGFLLFKRFPPQKTAVHDVQEGYVLVAIVWIVAILVGAVPFMFNSGLNFTQAVFESTSGWTTTGLSVVDVAGASRLILFFRSLLQLAGGAGFAIIAVSALSGVFGVGLSLAEGRTDQLAPHIRQSASIVLRLYAAYIVFGVLGLRIAGMDWFDAVNHAFAAVSTGGFSTRPLSVGHWNSAAIEAVLIVLMILGTTNFVIVYLLVQGRVRVVLRNGEIRFMAVSIVLTTVLLVALVTTSLYATLEKSVRVAIFEVVSAMTTTGFSSVDYRPWGDFGWMILILLMLIGGGTGSTSGGIKQFRIYLMYKSIIWEIRRAFMPRHMVNEPAYWQGEKRQVLNDAQVRRVALFVGLYVSVFLIGAGIFTAYGYPLRDSLFEFASALGTVGISVGVTNAAMPPALLGRLEFFTIIVGLLKLAGDARVMFLMRDERHS